jgi:pSer/pThr/pTyr-binding forkhead associated (FHA) protein
MGNKRQLRGHSGPVVEQIIKLGEDEITLGRDLANDVVIADSEVSRVHARISWENDQHVVRDLKSTNGTWLNGRSVLGLAQLHLGDLLTLGKTSVFVYELVPNSELDTTWQAGEEDLATSTIAMPVTPEVARVAREVAHPRPALGPAAPSPAPAEAAPAPAGKSFHEKYVAFLRAGDLEGLLSLYHPDAVLLTLDGRATGPDEIRAYFHRYFGGIGHAHATPTGRYVEGPNSFLYESILSAEGQVMRAQDAFVLKDGKATHHFVFLVDSRAKQS